MTFIIQVQVEADNAKLALDKIAEGDVISVNPRPQQSQQPQPAGVVTGRGVQVSPQR